MSSMNSKCNTKHEPIVRCNPQLHSKSVRTIRQNNASTILHTTYTFVVAQFACYMKPLMALQDFHLIMEEYFQFLQNFELKT